MVSDSISFLENGGLGFENPTEGLDLHGEMSSVFCRFRGRNTVV